MLAGTIGSRPVGSPANARAREYVVDQLKQIGFQVRVQETDARRHELGRTARVSNIIGILPGEQPDALGIVSHYDSSPDAPGATDDALGVAVTLEAARVLASAGRPRWTLLALITDAEEAGLMGAAALVTDREVTSRLRAYINLESIGSSGTSMLFETGPGNAWLVAPWARRAPHPRGGSYAIEVYTRLPNDTDFSILKTRDVPGLNFAAVGDSYAYHTARDTPERLSRETVRTTGENVVSIATALQAADITDENVRHAGVLRHRRHGRRQLRHDRALADLGAGIDRRGHRLGASERRRRADQRRAALGPHHRLGLARRAARGRRDGRRDLAAARRPARSITRGTRGRAGCCSCCSSPASPSRGAWPGWAAGCRREAIPPGIRR